MSVRILLVEDDEDDVFFMRRALRRVPVEITLDVCNDGQTALDYLLRQGAYAERAGEPLPAVVFLDLKLPYLHGLEVLAVIRRTPALADLNVVVLTSSNELRDRVRAEQLGALRYLVKPPTPAMVTDVLAAAGAGK